MDEISQISNTETIDKMLIKADFVPSRNDNQPLSFQWR